MEKLRRAAFVLALLIAMWFLSAGNGHTAMSKTISGVGDPFLVFADKDYLAGGAVKADTGTPTFTDEVSWYSDNAASALISTTTIFSGTATPLYSDNTWLLRVTSPSTAKSARRNHTGTVTGTADLKWGPDVWRDAPDTVATDEASIGNASAGGTVHFSLDGLYISRSDDANWVPFGPIWEAIQPNWGDYTGPTGGATLNQEKRSSNISIDTAAAGVDVKQIVKPINSDTTLVVGLIANNYDIDFQRYGLIVIDQTGADAEAFSIGHNGTPVMEAIHFGLPNTVTAINQSVDLSQSGVLWLKVLIDGGGTQLLYFWSRDKVFWNHFYTQDATELSRAIDSWGIFLDCNNANYPFNVTVLSIESF